MKTYVESYLKKKKKIELKYKNTRFCLFCILCKNRLGYLFTELTIF